ncbi:MAG: hypothetical protein MUF71_01025 [Candidatus Kapabacteria bacterium]|jgi:hypothetical protein|nr:hypothetical protein [Candidatus Kapabacteria bacterium]
MHTFSPTHCFKSRYFLLALLVVVCIVGKTFAQSNDTRTRYEGTIGKASVRATLQAKSDIIIGTYQYAKVGKDLELQGALRGKDSIILKEFDEQERQTGLFKGRYSGKGTPAESITGIWSRPDGSKPTPFTLRAAGTSAPPTQFDFYSGRYKRPGTHSAELNVRQLPDGKLALEGEAYWMGNNNNVHTGDISGTVSVKDFQAVYTDNNMPCTLKLTFASDEKIKKAIITVSGDEGNCGGMNVTFNGTYIRVSATPVFRNVKK